MKLGYRKIKALLIICLCILSSTYAMEDEEKQKAITDLLDIIKATATHNSPKKEEWDNALAYLENNDKLLTELRLGLLKKPLISFAVTHEKRYLLDYLLLKLGAKIDDCDARGHTSLYEAIVSTNPNSNFINLLIKYKANIHLEGPNQSLLKDAIKKNDATVKMACNFGARLTNFDDKGNSIFHILAINKRDPNFIRTILTHAHVTIDNKEITETIKTVLLVFNRINNDAEYRRKYGLPQVSHDIQIYILLKLLSPDCFHKGLYKQLPKNCKSPFPPNLAVNRHINKLIEILQIKNQQEKTAVELLPKREGDNNIKAMKNLLDANTLKIHLKNFNANFDDRSLLDKKNLALEIYNIHYAPGE